MLNGDPGRAADLYELADELAPSAPALRNATRARLAAGHLATAATHAVALQRRYPGDRESRDLADAVLGKLGPQLTRFDVICTAPCTILIDGKVVVSTPREQQVAFSQPGARTVTAVFGDGRKTTSQLTAVAGRTATVRLELPARPAEPPPAPREPLAPAAGRPRTDRPAAQRASGLSRWWVLGGGVITAGLATGMVIEGLATLSTRDQIRTAQEMQVNDPRTIRDLYNTGRDQQMATNLLLGATISAAIGTAVLAAFTNWSGEREISVAPTRDRVSLVWGGSF